MCGKKGTRNNNNGEGKKEEGFNIDRQISLKGVRRGGEAGKNNLTKLKSSSRGVQVGQKSLSVPIRMTTLAPPLKGGDEEIEIGEV